MKPNSFYVAWPEHPEKWPITTLNHFSSLMDSKFFQFKDREQCELFMEEVGLIKFKAIIVFRPYTDKNKQQK